MKTRLYAMISFLLFLTFAVSSEAQVSRLPYNYASCPTSVHDTGYYMRNAEAFLAEALAKKGIDSTLEDFSAPYYVRVFIRIVRQDNGTLPGCTMAEALQNFNEMNVQYNNHNICFQLVGMDFINDSYLNNFNTSANLDDVYPAYIRDNNLDVNGAMTIFIHYNFLNNSGSSGNAYGIPNNFMSIARWAATSTSVHSIFGHEMGHCLGLYHTFEQVNGVQESVTRNTGNSCYNCYSDGDLCCDTPADYEDSQDNTSSTTCIYSGTRENSCDGLDYNPSTVNIMSYQPWECISTGSAAITANQRIRMHATINNTTGPVYSRVSEDAVTINATSISSNTVRIYGAKNTIVTNNGSAISNTANAQVYYAAGGSITLNPGVTFSPGAAGIVNAMISGCN